MRVSGVGGSVSRLPILLGRSVACLVLLLTSITVMPGAAPTAAASSVPNAPATGKSWLQNLAPGISSSGSVETPPASQAKAKAKPEPTEIASRRTEYSRTYDNHDGTFTTEISPAPIHYRTSSKGAWQPIDYTFVASADGKHLRASHNLMPIEVSGPEDADGFLSVESQGKTIRLRLASDATPGNADAKPIADPGMANVHGLLPNVDLRVYAGSSSAATFLILRSAPASPKFTFELDSPGVTPTLQDDGSIVFEAGDGTVVATMPHPYAVDSSVDEALGGGQMTDQVSYSLATHGSKTLLTVSVDADWLRAATYPVYVDPTLQGTSVVTDNFVTSKYPTTRYSNYQRPDSPYYHELWLGMDPTNSANVNYDFIKFNLSSITGSISSASLQVYPYHQYYNAPRATTTWVRRVSANWSTSTLTWNNQPGTTALTSAGLVEGSWGSFDVTSTVQAWLDGASNYGFMLWENGNNGTYWKRLISSEDSTGRGPKLVITYAPPVVSGLSPTGGASTNGRTLSWSYSDPGGLAQKTYAVTVSTSPVLSTGTVTSSATSYSIPTSTTLTSGTTYNWTVQVTNTGDVASDQVSGSFVWDVTPPPPPTINQPPAPVRQASTSYTFSWSAVADAADYEVTKQTAAISTPGTCGSAWSNVGSPQIVTGTSFTYSGMTGGACYRIAVRSRDAVGNLSTTYSYSNPVLVDTTQAGWSAPDLVVSGPGVYQAAPNAPAYVKAGNGTAALTASEGTVTSSGLACIEFTSLTPSTGWTPNPSLPYCDTSAPYIELASWNSLAVTATVNVRAKNGALTMSATRSVGLIPDAGPAVNFSSPVVATTTIQSASSFEVAWSELSASGVVSRSLQRQKAAVVTPGTCSDVNWADDGSPVTGASPVAANDLAGGFCYRWLLTLTDHVGNAPTLASGSVLVDTTPAGWSAPDVVVSGDGVYQDSANGPAYVKAGAGTATLTATESTVPPSGLACIEFRNLTPSTGWAPDPDLPSCDASDPYTESASWTSSAVAVSVDARAQNGAETMSATRSVGLIPDSGPLVNFVTPAVGTTTIQSALTFDVAWSELSASGLTSRSLQRQKAAIVQPGTCSGVSWANDGAPDTSATSPVSASNLAGGFCYRWLLTLTDHVGNAPTLASGSVLVDTTGPTLAWDRPTGQSAYFRAGADGSMSITFTGTDADSGIESIAFGELSAPQGWDYEPSTVSGASATLALSWSPSAETTSFTATATNKVGMTVSTTITLVADSDPPTADFSYPDEGASIVQASTSVVASWNEADAGSGVFVRIVVRQKASIPAPGSCAGIEDSYWAWDGDYSYDPSPALASDLEPGYCYRWWLGVIDGVNNAAIFTSGTVLVDTTAPAAPGVSVSSSPATYRVGDSVFFRPSAAGSLTVDAVAGDAESGIDGITFGPLTAPTGWSYSPGTSSGGSATRALGWSSSAGSADITVTSTNNAGSVSPGVTLQLIADSQAPTAVFSSLSPGPTTVQASTSVVVSWSESDTGSGTASRTLQRQRASVVTAGTCAGVSWSDDGGAAALTSPVGVEGLASGRCYRWVVTLADNVGNSATSVSGAVLIDAGEVCSPDVSALGAGVYQVAANGTVYFAMDGAGSITLISSVPCSPPSGVQSVTYANLTPSVGWSPNPGLPNAATSPPYTQTLTPSAGSLASTIDATLTTGAGVTSAARTISLVPDGTPPSTDFANPDEGSFTIQADATFALAWADTDDFGAPGSGVASRSLQRRIAQPIEGACPAANDSGWHSDGGPDTSPVSGSSQTLQSGRCYDWQLTISDRVGNSSSYASGSVLIDQTPEPPDVTASGAGVFQASPNGTVYVRADGATSATLTATDAAPGLGSITFQGLSSPTGWTSSPSLPNQVAGSPAAQQLTPSAGSGPTDLSVVASTRSGVQSDVRVVQVIPDANAPVAEIAAPAPGTTTPQTTGGYSIAWSSVDEGSGIATQSLQRRRVLANDGACPAPSDPGWQDDGDPATVQATVVNATGLASGYCYEWTLSLTDRVGNVASYTSGAVLIDSAAWGAPSIVASGPYVYQAAPDAQVYFKSDTSGSVTLTATVSATASGVSDVTFDGLTAAMGWTADPSLPNIDTSGPYTQVLTREPSAGPATIDVVGHNKAGGSSFVRTLALEADGAAPIASFDSPGAGSLAIHNSAEMDISWSESDGGSGLASYSLQRQSAPIATVGTCDGVSWANSGEARSGTATGSQAQVTETSLESGFCYRWVLVVDDHVGNRATATSGSVLIDLEAPVAAFATPPSNSVLVTTQGTYSAQWTAMDTGSGIAGSSIQREVTTLGSDGLCAAESWQPDGPASNGSGPLSGSDLVIGSCYRWSLSLTDAAGNGSNYTSGIVAVSRVKLDYPLPGWTLFSTETLHASVADGDTADAVDFIIDGSVIGTVTAEPYALDIDTTAWADGDHAFSVRLTIDGSPYRSPDSEIAINNSLGPLARVNADYEAQRLSLDQYVLLATFAFGAPEVSPDRYGASVSDNAGVWPLQVDFAAASGDALATMNDFNTQPLRGLLYAAFVSAPAAAQTLNPGSYSTVECSVDPADPYQNAAQAMVASLPWGGCVMITDHFTIYFPQRGTAPSGMWTSPVRDELGLIASAQGYALQRVANGDGLPDLLDTYAVQLEQARAFYSEPMLHPDQPIPASGVSAGGLGFRVPDRVTVNVKPGGNLTEGNPILPFATPGCGSVMYLDDGYAELNYAATHEMFHAAQFLYKPCQAGKLETPLLEQTAEWAAARFAAKHQEYWQDPPSGFYETDQYSPWYQTTDYWKDPGKSVLDPSGYNQMLFPEYVTEHYRADFVLRVFEGQTFEQAMGSVPNVFAGYGLANYFLSFVPSNLGVTDVRYLYTHPQVPRISTFVRQNGVTTSGFSRIKAEVHDLTGTQASASGRVDVRYLGLGYVELIGSPGDAISVDLNSLFGYQAQVVAVGPTGYCGEPIAIDDGSIRHMVVRLTSTCPHALIAMERVAQHWTGGVATWAASRLNSGKQFTSWTSGSGEPESHTQLVAVDNNGNAYIYDAKVIDYANCGSDCDGGWIRKIDKTGQVLWSTASVGDVNSLAITGSDSAHGRTPALVAASVHGQPYVTAYELGDGNVRYPSFVPWIDVPSSPNLRPYSGTVAPGPDGGVFYGGVSVDEINYPTYFGAIDSGGHYGDQSLNTAPGVFGSTPARDGFWGLLASWFWCPAGGSTCFANSEVTRYGADGSVDTSVSPITLYCVQLVDAHLPFDYYLSATIDPVQGTIYVQRIRMTYNETPTYAGWYPTESWIDAFDATGHPIGSSSLATIFGATDVQDVHFGAANGRLVVAGTYTDANGFLNARVAVSNGIGNVTDRWDWGNSAPGSQVELTSVAVNPEGIIWISGHADSDFDGLTSTHEAGWVTSFVAS